MCYCVDSNGRAIKGTNTPRPTRPDCDGKWSVLLSAVQWTVFYINIHLGPVSGQVKLGLQKLYTKFEWMYLDVHHITDHSTSDFVMFWSQSVSVKHCCQQFFVFHFIPFHQNCHAREIVTSQNLVFWSNCHLAIHYGCGQQITLSKIYQ